MENNISNFGPLAFNDFESYINSSEFEQYMKKLIDEAKRNEEQRIDITLISYLNTDYRGWLSLFTSLHNEKVWNSSFFTIKDYESVFDEKLIEQFIDCLEDWMHHNNLSYRKIDNKLHCFNENIRRKIDALSKDKLDLQIEIRYAINLNEI